MKSYQVKVHCGYITSGCTPAIEKIDIPKDLFCGSKNNIFLLIFYKGTVNSLTEEQSYFIAMEVGKKIKEKTECIGWADPTFQCVRSHKLRTRNKPDITITRF
jgi:hypothetical protein